MNITKSGRNAKFECLRIISMIMVVFLHALSKSELLVDLTMENMKLPNTWIAWILEVLCVGAVNIFMLISGYFLVESEFKLSRLIELVAQTVFYSIGGFALCYATGIIQTGDLTIYFILDNIFPIHMEMFWFITAYVLVYILQPVLAKGIKAISKRRFQTVLVLCLIYECFLKSFVPIRFTSDTKGYSFFWYVIVFMIGAYFRLYGFVFLSKPHRGMIIYCISSAVNLALVVAVQYVVVHMEHLEDLINYSLEYNHILVLAASVGIFAAFATMKDRQNGIGKVICYLSPMALGVYLFHENLSVRYEWQHWLGLRTIADKPPIVFLGRIVLAVLIVYLTGTLVDYIRIWLFKFAKYMIGKAKRNKV